MFNTKKPIFKEYWIWFIFVLCLLASTYFLQRFTGPFLYDLTHSNPPVYTYRNAIDILHAYPRIRYRDLPEHMKRQFSKATASQRHALTTKEFYVIPRKDLYRKIFIANRMNSFLSGEYRLSSFHFWEEGYAYLCIHQELLEAAFMLSDKFRLKGYDQNAIQVNSGFRTLAHNERVRGARNSMHIYGSALDLRIRDINKDGIIDQSDKDIVYKMLDQQIIKSRGGLGYYPNTMILHMDVRGVKARWDFHKRSYP